jgi:hypothetical protein
MFLPAYAIPETNVTTNQAIQFYTPSSCATNESDEIPIKYMDIPTSELGAFIEGKIFTLVNRDIFLRGRSENKSFDPVYLCDLQADLLNRHDFYKIKITASRIVDKSEEIFFDDGMDE